MKKKYINYLIKELRMNRSIMRGFRKKFPEIKKQCPNTTKKYDLQFEIIKALQALKTRLEGDTMKWISVKDRLPKGEWAATCSHLSEDVLIANSCSINIGFYDRERDTWYVGEPAAEEWIDKITHWMPLPKSPHERRTE